MFKRRKSETVEASGVDEDDQEPEPVATGSVPEAEVSVVMASNTCRSNLVCAVGLMFVIILPVQP